MRLTLRPGHPHAAALRHPVLACLALGLMLGASPAVLPAGPMPAQAKPGAPAGATTGLSVEQARDAANRILKAVQTRDPNLRYAQFSPELQAISSPAMVAQTMRTQPRLLNWTLLSVRGGLSTTTVEATLETSDGPRDLFMVLNSQGQLAGYHLDLTDAKASLVAADFVRALSSGHFITARSFLSLPLQEELTPAILQTKWQQLQRITGNFQRVLRVIEADRTSETQLVLVNTEFNRVTDNLYVILNTNNEITGVDFPSEPKPPARAEAPAS
ncbi:MULTISPECIES: hypothetical protein [Aphanothece]|uniref:hypothetical protein n=1 Tax=Aphanothece TaxID=1121 RepID=UPI0039849016